MKTGERLGPYEILAPLGKGGMGEVWKARDTRLGRDVAIKISAEQFSERFEREARAVAALNHPNICTLYDVGPNYLVMEYIEGATLADRIKEGPIQLEEALSIARHVADALDAAHEKNIIHRDLKPGNIKVKPDGTVKVLDFGLAKMGGTPTAGKTEDSPTLTLAATQAGMILGTAAYMSPEQARGKEVDKRADIWAFGAVFYEMLTGERLFQGTDTADTLAAVLRHEPDWHQVPAQVRRLLGRCLERDPAKRLRSIGDVMELVERVSESRPAVVGSRQPVQMWIVMAGTAAFVALVLGFALYRATRPAPLKPLVRLDVDLGPDVTLDSPAADVIISPDGTRIAYVSQGRLFTRKLDQTRATELAGTQGVTSPFFSPDGQWIGFTSQAKLRKISVEGGTPIVLCDTASIYTGDDWGEDGNIIASLSSTGRLVRVPATGGAPVAITDFEHGEGSHRWPQILPGGKAVLFTANPSSTQYDNATIKIVNLADHRQKIVQRGATFGRYLATSKNTGHLIYVNRATLFAVPFDLEKLETVGSPVPILDQVAYSSFYGSALLSLSRDGTLIYRSGAQNDIGLWNIQRLDATGKAEPLLPKPGLYRNLTISPDGRRIAFTVGDPSGVESVWTYEPQRDLTTRITFGEQTATNPVWTPDGKFIVYQAQGGVFWTRSDGAGKPEVLVQGNATQFPTSFSPDGRRLAFNQIGREQDIWTIPIERDGTGLRAGKPELFLRTDFNERQASFSTDGKWLAYTSNESGSDQVYVRAFPDHGGRWQISSAGGNAPVFSPNGHELFFQNGDRQVMVTSYSVQGDSFVAERPRVWAEARLAGANLRSYIPVPPDGKRVLALIQTGHETQQATGHVIFLQNFFDELRRKVPLK